MPFNDVTANKKIIEFFRNMLRRNFLSVDEDVALMRLLVPPKHTFARIGSANWGQKLFAALGLYKRTSEKGAAGKVDNLLLALHIFAALFVMAAVVPLFFIYWEYSYIVLPLLVCPAIHVLARYLSRYTTAKRETVQLLHMTAALLWWFPMLFLIHYVETNAFLQTRMESSWFWLVWPVYLITVAVLIRNRHCLLFAMGLLVILMNGLVVHFELRIGNIVTLNLAVSTLLVYYAGLRRRAGDGMFARQLGMVAAFCGILTAIWTVTTIDKMSRGYLVYPFGTVPGLVWLFPVVLILFSFVAKLEMERVRGVRFRNAYLALLTATWLYPGVLLYGDYAARFGRGMALRGVPLLAFHAYSPWIVLSLLTALWGAWLVYELLQGKRGFSVVFFQYAAILLFAGLFVLYCLLAGISDAALLGLAIGVYFATSRIKRRYYLAAAATKERLEAEEAVWELLPETPVDEELAEEG